MALILHPPPSSSSSSSFTTIKPHFRLRPKPGSFSIKARKDPSTEETTSDSSSGPGPSAKKPLGFGSSAAASRAAPAKKKQKENRKRERASVTRREPFEKINFAGTPQQAARAEELSKNESAFLLAWLGLGGVILLEGITLAASGFLPEAWDKFFVKYLYPFFTPTVFLFVAGTVGYGVLKYLQNEKPNAEN